MAQHGGMYLTERRWLILCLYGKESVIRTHAKTVGELLKEKNIDPKKDDTLPVDRSAKLFLNEN